MKGKTVNKRIVCELLHFLGLIIKSDFNCNFSCNLSPYYQFNRLFQEFFSSIKKFQIEYIDLHRVSLQKSERKSMVHVCYMFDSMAFSLDV